MINVRAKYIYPSSIIRVGEGDNLLLGQVTHTEEITAELFMFAIDNQITQESYTILISANEIVSVSRAVNWI